LILKNKKLEEVALKNKKEEELEKTLSKEPTINTKSSGIHNPFQNHLDILR